MAKEVLRTEGVVKKFGEFIAVNKVSVSFYEGERTAIIGPNGAGKTTLVNVISGKLHADSGRVLLDGEDITSIPAHQRVKKGLNRTFQVPSVFKSLSVRENLRVAGGENSENYDEIVKELGLKPYLDIKAGQLPFGLMKILELGMAIISKPRILLLDEPTAGLNVAEKEKIIALLQQLSARTSLVVVEHDMDVVFTLSKRIVVMHRGEIIADGPPQEIAVNERVREVYLG